MSTSRKILWCRSACRIQRDQQQPRIRAAVHRRPAFAQGQMQRQD